MGCNADRLAERCTGRSQQVHDVSEVTENFGNDLRAAVCESHQPGLPGPWLPLNISDANAERQTLECFYMQPGQKRYPWKI